MQYKIQFKPRALKDARKVPKNELKYIFERIEDLKNSLTGDVKHLTSLLPEYRLRVGRYRVLFEVENDVIIVYRIRHRKDIYR